MDEKETFVVSGKRVTMVWRLVSLVLFVLLLIMTSLFIWQAVKTNEQQSSGMEHKSSDAGSILRSPCPLIPDLRPLPKTLPSVISDVLKQVESDLAAYVDNALAIPAISANIFYQNDVIWSGHYGSKTSKEPAGKPDGDTRYRIASVSKIFPVLMAYKLYEDGQIESLDDAFNKYAPDFHIINIFTLDNITIREMTSQMSGLPREAPCVYNCSDTSTSEQLSLLRNRSLVMTPFTQPTYSNLAYALIGRVLAENILNQTYESWVIDNILNPLGMRDTGFEITAAVEKNMAYPYNNDGNLIKFIKTGWIGPAAEMYSTLNDLTKLGRIFAQPHKQALFREASLREILLPQHIAPDGRTLWGAPWEILFLNGFAIRGKAGNIDSYNTFVSVIPELQLGMNILVSAAPITGSSSVAILITERIYKALLPAFNQIMVELNEQAAFPITAEPYIGEYYIKNTNPITNVVKRFTASITAHNGVLKLVSFGTEIGEIRYVGDPVFFQFKLGSLQGRMSCFAERSGVYHELYFEEPAKSGLCPGFEIPGVMKLSAVRVSSENSRVAAGADEVPDFSWLQQIY